MTEDEIKSFIEDRLVIEIELDDKSGPGNSVSVSLKFKGSEPFCREGIYIPEEL